MPLMIKTSTSFIILVCFFAFFQTMPLLAAEAANSDESAIIHIVPALTYPDEVKTTVQKWQWEYDGNTYSWQAQIPEELVTDSRNIYQAVSRLYYTNSAARQKEVLAQYDDTRTLKLMLSLAYAQPRLGLWSNDQLHDEYLTQMANTLGSFAVANGFSSFQTADFILSWVGSIPFRLTNYTELPGQTLVDGGDCKGKSILYAAILNKLDYTNKFFLYKPTAASPKGHLAVGVAFDVKDLPYADKDYFYYTFDSARYYYAETTDTGYHIGDVRPTESIRQPMVIPTL